jgi:hypothetical protein
MDVTYFRPRRPGPEADIENTITAQIPVLFPSENRPIWTAGSLPIGAGMPDLVIVSCEPEVFMLCQIEIPSAHILAYLRAVSRASLDTIAGRVGLPRPVIIRCLDGLVEVEILTRQSNSYSLSPVWREILPEIVTIEVKVVKWRRAVMQAARNRIFAHKSFIALPDQVAQRIRFEPIFNQLGIGLLSVRDNDVVNVLRRSRRRQPRVWTYYYEIASFVARYFEDNNNALQYATRTGED